MELKSYQKQVISDLSDYFEYLQKNRTPDKAFNSYWRDKTGVYDPSSGEGMRPYRDHVPGAVQLCIKVPTAGGKTFIACNALRTIFNAMPEERPKAVVWLVPWGNLLEQTVRNLSDPEHPYCQKLNMLFGNRIAVYEKKDLLFGAGFNASSVKEQLSIMVMNFASIRAKNKDDRKIFEQNGALSSFAQSGNTKAFALPDTDESALINVIRSLNPVLILDESHNAESDLSVEMLRNLNPSFILDLTATPKENANIISLVPAIELKKEHMVKLPVIVYNHRDKEAVIESALHLQRKLELLAEKLEQDGGKYIRPIILFQAESKTKDDSTTFGKIKEQLINYGIPEEEIKIKTANVNELKGIDLLDKDCKVRYIITINALKEGWDCPFAYILASLADKSSETDVTQILGRVLRQPYVMKHNDPMLNLSYVITASSKFNETLQSIVKGLKESGFSEKDYREEEELIETPGELLDLPTSIVSFKFNSRRIPYNEYEDQQTVPVEKEEEEISIPFVKKIEEIAIRESIEMQKRIDEAPEPDLYTPDYSDVGIKVKRYGMREEVSAIAKSIVLPRFVMRRPKLQFFDEHEFELLDRVNLLDGFKLAEQDAIINFDGASSELYKIDVETESKVSSFKVEEKTFHKQVMDMIMAKPRAGQIKDITHQVMQQIGKIYPIIDQDIKNYVMRILDNLDSDKLREVLLLKYTYTDKIKQKISTLADVHAEKKFKEWQLIDKIRTQPQWKFPDAIVPADISGDYGNSLYLHEGEMNGLEEQFIMEICGCENIAFWHRNLGKGKGFALNGHRSDHYPDFIIVTKSGKIILVETKGADRDNSDSKAKLQLGQAWADLSGKENYKYLMVFDNTAHPPEGAYNLDKARELILQM